MRRSTVLLVMLFAMLWQSMASTRIDSTVNVLADMDHAALHWQQKGHHHHEDGSYQLDDSNESVQHLLSDHANAIAALMTSTSHAFPPPGSTSPSGLQDTPASPPFLDGLFKPPRPRA